MATVIPVGQSKDDVPNDFNFTYSGSAKKGEETDWRSVRVISVIFFLSAIQLFVIGMSEWPYMQQLDPLSTSTFFGLVGSAAALGHAVFAPLFGYWSSATGKARIPLIVSRIIALVGCVVYICIEMFPRNRRYMMLICYTIFGISLGSISIMRSYIAKVSTVSDRTKAVSIFGLAHVLAISIGPVFQLLFTPLSYPGVQMLGKQIRLNIYTGPIYVATVANVVCLVIILVCFKDYKAEEDKPVVRRGLERRPSKAVKALTTDMRSFSMSLALVCIFTRMIGALTFNTIHTTSTPLMMSVFGWSNTHTVKVASVTQATIGIVSLAVFIGFATGKLSKILSERLASLIALLLFGLFFLLTYPYPFAGKQIRLKDVEHNVTGCDASVYKWCATSVATSPAVYLGTLVLVLGLAASLSAVSVDTLYSKILGKIDQGTMQGVFLFAHDIVNVGGPLVIAPLFTVSGQKYIWAIDLCFIIMAAICWSVAYKKFPKGKAD